MKIPEISAIRVCGVVPGNTYLKVIEKTRLWTGRHPESAAFLPG